MSTTAGRVLQVIFTLAAIAVVMAFISAARDGERRRAPEALLGYLRPDYVGNNRLAPDFELRDRNGRAVRLSQYRGKVVVLHFWSRTCPPCVDELQRSIPAFDEIVRDRDDIAFVMVNTDAGWDAIAPIVPAGIRAPILFDPARRVVTGRYGTRLFPETWVIDREGIIRARFDHTIEWDSPVFLGYLTALR